MKLLHLGDLHLGKSLGDYDLIKDQEYILNQILNLVDQESVDGVLIAGDVWDKAIPSEAATKLLDLFLTKLSEKRVKTYMISGNHDSDDRLKLGKRTTQYANAKCLKPLIFNEQDEGRRYKLSTWRAPHK